MLAGLIFATEDAVDRPDMLAETLPFAGGTLIEFQARLLIAAGAGQIIVVVARLTPELVGAVNRIGRRGGSVDIVRSASEAAAKLHPLAHVLVIADGLVTDETILALLAGAGDDALLVTGEVDALPGLERVGQDAIWAGMARVGADRITDVAHLPGDYDFQSALLRVTAQSGAVHLRLPSGEARAGHGVERDAARLRARNEVVLTGHVSNRIPWVDRYLIAPLARLVLPRIVARSVPGWAIAAGSSALLAAGIGITGWGWGWLGLPFVLVAMAGLSIGGALAWMRDETALVHLQRGAILGGSGLTMLALGIAVSRSEGTLSATSVAVALVVIAGFVERGGDDRIRQSWWGTPIAYPLILLPFAIAGQTLTGLMMTALYATASLAAAIEALRESLSGNLTRNP
ncbi:MAG: hypothetical protein B7Y45_09810 [Sphingomonas sp. 28-66-16]|nr:MAG: hypothetical protein B7Y45_09810 [Sphingomonas sp. 28-66-16]